ncbi:probable LRR receptor-like serine/threonine-protein kinase At3g47570 [Hevea brasiliensis]|uniref:probable LRR receptor-like serine/threonine-protein kinase At3g47570 n=1 Tax=Hevea brasiliensis TaxID=3981 RepID=UPI0025ED7D6E|nr:probable LRR receptor-like serine/threonine-protein kinase At3g47570 [Hevea brasiliensis]
MSECIALKNIRHRNLVKVLSACSGVDFQGNDFKALIFEFMPKGNLDEWIHPENNVEDSAKVLNFLQRLNIAIDVASAIEYLHSHCRAIIVHSDLKPSNILLDAEITAHVGDFGLARIISPVPGTGNNEISTTSTTMKGSIGYIAPEYGVSGNLSTKADVYSFGIILLEMFTGRRPTEEIFTDDLTLHNFVSRSLPEKITQVMDPVVHSEANESGKAECCISVLRIGIKCSMESAKDRAAMEEVVNELCSIRQVFLDQRV